MFCRNPVIFLAVLLLGKSVHAAPLAYVPNAGDATVSVIDTATNRVTATVPIGSGPYAVAATKGRVFVLDAAGLEAIDTVSNKVVGRMSIPSARAVAATEDSSHVYVATDPNHVVIVDSGLSSVLATINTQQDSPAAIAASPDGNTVFVANNHDPTERPHCDGADLFCDLAVSIIDTRVSSEINRVLVGDRLSSVAVGNGGRLVYVTHIGLDTGNVYGFLTVFASDQSGFFKRIRVIEGPGAAFAVAADLSAPTAYVVLGTSLRVVDPVAGRVSANLELGSENAILSGVSVTPDGRRVYVPRSDGMVVVLDTATKNIVATIPVGRAPYAFGQFISGDSSPRACTGDCNSDAEVSIDEVLTCVNIALGNQSIDSCPACTCSGCETTVADVIAAVNNALGGC